MDRKLEELMNSWNITDAEDFAEDIDNFGESSISDKMLDNILSSTLRKAGYEMNDIKNGNSVITDTNKITAAKTAENKIESSSKLHLHRGSAMAACVAALLAVSGGMFLLNSSFDKIAPKNDNTSSVAQRTELESKAESKAETAAEDTKEDKQDKETESEESQTEPVVITYVDDSSAETKADNDNGSKAETTAETKPETVTNTIVIPAEDTAEDTAPETTEETVKPAKKQHKKIDVENDGVYWLNDDKCLILHRDLNNVDEDVYELYDASSDKVVKTISYADNYKRGAGSSHTDYLVEPIIIDNGFAFFNVEAMTEYYNESFPDRFAGDIVTATVYDLDGNVRYEYKVDTRDCSDYKYGPAVDGSPAFINDGSKMILKINAFDVDIMEPNMEFYQIDANDGSIEYLGNSNESIVDSKMYQINDDVFAFEYYDDGGKKLAFASISAKSSDEIIYDALGTTPNLDNGHLQLMDGGFYYIGVDEYYNSILLVVKPDDGSNESFNVNGSSFSVTKYDFGKYSDYDYDHTMKDGVLYYTSAGDNFTDGKLVIIKPEFDIDETYSLDDVSYSISEYDLNKDMSVEDTNDHYFINVELSSDCKYVMTTAGKYHSIEAIPFDLNEDCTNYMLDYAVTIYEVSPDGLNELKTVEYTQDMKLNTSGHFNNIYYSARISDFNEETGDLTIRRTDVEKIIYENADYDDCTTSETVNFFN